MYSVVGFKKIVSKKDGTRFVEIYLLSDDKFVTGQRCDIVFVREDMISNFDCLVLGCSVQVFYNRFARAESVSVIV